MNTRSSFKKTKQGPRSNSNLKHVLGHFHQGISVSKGGDSPMKVNKFIEKNQLTGYTASTLKTDIASHQLLGQCQALRWIWGYLLTHAIIWGCERHVVADVHQELRHPQLVQSVQISRATAWHSNPDLFALARCEINGPEVLEPKVSAVRLKSAGTCLFDVTLQSQGAEYVCPAELRPRLMDLNAKYGDQPEDAWSDSSSEDGRSENWGDDGDVTMDSDVHAAVRIRPEFDRIAMTDEDPKADGSSL